VVVVKIDKQRLDSTHIFSDMASFSRTRLMGVAIKRFLTQVIRHNKEDYNSLEESFRNRYAPGVNQLFAGTKPEVCTCGSTNEEQIAVLFYSSARTVRFSHTSKRTR